jgi:AcrR family transcriptional regulator
MIAVSAIGVYLVGMKSPDSGAKRPYRMGARAEATAATGERILDAAEAAFYEQPGDEVTLAAVAESAGVTVQTVLRRFGNRQALFGTALARAAARVSLQRGSAPVGDVEGAMRVLVDHYEELGDRVLRVLAEEGRSPVLHALTDIGRAYHREWCKRVFAPTLSELDGAELERRTAQLVAVTDVYVWKLLRRDQGLGREQTERAMRELVEPLTVPAP